MKPYYRPILDPVFKYIMQHEEMRNDFIGNVIGETIIHSELLDASLNPLPMYKDLRDLINQGRIQELMAKFEGMDPAALVYNSPDKEIRLMVAEVLNFISSLAPKYYQLVQAIPSPERHTQMDVVCKTENGFINIEVQNQPQNYWDLRILDHVCGLFHRQFDKGFKWKELENDALISHKIKRSIGISILDKAPRKPENVGYNLPWYDPAPWGEDELKRVYNLRDKNDSSKIRPGIEFYDFNLQAFHILRKSHGFGDCSESLVEWLEFFATASKKSKKDVENVKSKVVQKVYSLIEHLPRSVEQETVEFFERLENISFFAKAMEEDGEKRGKAEGIKIGEARGIELGEHKKAIAIAKEMLENGSDIAFISRCTGLSIDEINKLTN